MPADGGVAAALPGMLMQRGDAKIEVQGTTSTAGGSCPQRPQREFRTRLSPRFKHTTDWQQVSLLCISHNVFGVDLMAIENHVLVVLLLTATTNTMLRENRVKRPTRCGFIVGRSSLSIVARGSAVG
jgi:hypothetical protein